MPFYEYECRSCGHTLEAMQKVNDAPLKKCPDCGKSQLSRLMSAPVFRLKGGGWYETDFKGEQDNKKNLADRPESDAAKDDKKAPAEAKAADAKAPDSTAKDGKPADKAADKPAGKAADGGASKPSGGGPSKRGAAGSTAARSRGRKAPARKPAAKSKRR